MSSKKLVINSYLPVDKNKKVDNLGNLKFKIKNLNENKIFADTDDLKKLRRKKLSLEFIEMYTQGSIKSKTKFCKLNKISVQTLNKGLEENGISLKPKTSDTSSIASEEEVKKLNKKSKVSKEKIKVNEENKENVKIKSTSSKGGASKDMLSDPVKRSKNDEIINNLKI